MRDPYDAYQDPDPHASYMASLNDPKAAGGGASGGMANIAGAGIGAAGQTIGTLAQIIAQSQARQSALADAGLDRDSSTQLAKMRLRANSELADKERALQARNFLVQALTKQGSNAMTAWDTNRQANKAGSSLIAQAFL